MPSDSQETPLATLVILMLVRGEYKAKEPLMRQLYDFTRRPNRELQEVYKVQQSWPAGRAYQFNDPEVARVYDRENALKLARRDAAAALVLISAASIERVEKQTEIDLGAKGEGTYIDGITFSSAIWSLAIQYKHLGEWRSSRVQNATAAENVSRLVGDPLDEDAAATFILKCCSEFGDFMRRFASSLDQAIAEDKHRVVGIEVLVPYVPVSEPVEQPSPRERHETPPPTN